ncbi:uncharacterized protein C1orf21 isoform X1 [Triplophysa dalaica]|uniref:uncharacterized protein C1orf21 isoform X1 n=1 Tax=Triplophysa dalaica TaxID=1582913 RepID=UPI0024E00C73|nr:uncharacterized protein C1orf21 isoform X1 [Triplophysa dalaica]XP_056598279.1 uncharacterized protein C1orf21 isoform X1 [Triplophysa dalaica]
MGCTSAKQLSSVPNDEEGRGKNYSNGDAFSDEYKLKGVEKVKYMHGEEERMNTRNQENLEKSTFLHKGRHKDATGDTNKISIHSSESQQEFFRMLDEKIEKGRDFCAEDEDMT